MRAGIFRLRLLLWLGVPGPGVRVRIFPAVFCVPALVWARVFWAWALRGGGREMSVHEEGAGPEVHDPAEYTIATRWMDLLVAVALMVVAAVVMWDSQRIGIGWAGDGPEAGYFPFYIGLLMFIASAGTFVTGLVTKTPDNSNFVERSGFRSVLKVFIPTLIYVIAINFLGIYVASVIFIAFFMVWLGKYSWLVVAPVSLGVPLFLFFMFEIWFLLPLPKGPVEAMLGF